MPQIQLQIASEIFQGKLQNISPEKQLRSPPQSLPNPNTLKKFPLRFPTQQKAEDHPRHRKKQRRGKAADTAPNLEKRIPSIRIHIR